MRTREKRPTIDKNKTVAPKGLSHAENRYH